MQSTLTRRLGLLLVPFLLLGFLIACNGDDDDINDIFNGETPAPNGVGEVSFDVSMMDNRFDAEDFVVSPGQQVTFNLTNDGDELHNMRVAGEDNEFDTGEDTVSEPEIIAPGESGTLEWTAPQEAGVYAFRCDIHPDEMVGTIEVSDN